MEFEQILKKYLIKIIPLFMIGSPFLAISVCQDKIAPLYAGEVNAYDANYDLIDSYEDDDDDDDDDDKDLQFSVREEPDIDIAAKKTLAIRQATKCDENQLMTYLAVLQVTNPESLLLIASYKDLENLCRRITGNLDSIDSYLQTCTPLAQDHLYMQLIAGLRVLNAKLCIESDYKNNFRNYISCFHELHTEYVDCAGPADWTENMEHNELCKEYKLISDCYYTKSAMLCGLKAAKIMKELVVAVMNGIINIECPEVRNSPAVANAMPESVSSKASSLRGSKCFSDNLNFVLGSVREFLTSWIDFSHV